MTPRYPTWREMGWERRAVELQARKAAELARRGPPRYPCLGQVAVQINRNRRHVAAKKREHALLFVDAFAAALDPRATLPKCRRCGGEELARDYARRLYWCRACLVATTEEAVRPC